MTSAPNPSFKQPRARATYEALLDAAAEVFAERGFEATQTPEIAARAGVSTGALYRYFKDKRVVFVEVVRRHLARAHAEVTAELDPARLHGKDRRAAIATVVSVVFEHTRRHARLERVYAAMSLTDPDVEALRLELQASRLSGLAALIAALVPPEIAPSPAACARVIELAALEAAADWHRFGDRASPGVDEHALKEALADMFHRFLFPVLPPASSPPSPPSSRVPRARARSR